jgi:hypothetical protein
MGRRRNRKLERRRKERDVQADEPAVVMAWPGDSDWDDDPPSWGGLGRRGSLLGQFRSAGATCGTCTEFVEDGDTGRGRCLHPGSGVFAPYTDTGGCGFHTGARR